MAKLEKTRTGAPARKKAATSKTAPSASKKSALPKSAPHKSAARKSVPKPKVTPATKVAPKARKTAAGKETQKFDVVEHLRQRVSAALEELKAKDVHEIDVRGKTSIADFLVIASGTSTRHVKSIADEVVKYAKKAGMMPLGVEGQREAEWVLVDLGDIIVHIMLPRIREFYGLERLWTVGDDMPDAANAG